MATKREGGEERDAARFVATVWGLLILACSAAVWSARQYNVDHGLPCEARGTYGCGLLPPPAFAVWTLFVSLPFAAVAGIVWRLARDRAPRVATVVVVAVFLAWLAAMAVLFRAALVEL